MTAAWRVIALLLLSSGVLMAANGNRPLDAANAVVTLDVFSGRPNPTWRLSEQQTGELLRRLQALPVTTTQAAEFDGLGYRAVSVELQRDDQPVAVMTAFRGIVALDRGGQRTHHVDSGRDLESWLVNTGKDHVSPDVLRLVTGEIAKRR